MKKYLTALLFLFSSLAFALPNGFVYLHDVDPSIAYDIRYATYHNFTGVPVDGYEKAECILTAQAAQALKDVQAELIPMGYSLKVYDCYRPQRAVDHFDRWAKNLEDTRTKGEFYVHEDKKNLFVNGYIAHRSGHSRGGTVDLTIIRKDHPEQEVFVPYKNLRDCENSADKRFGDSSIDMGTGYDCFSQLASTLNTKTGGPQMKNRLLLRSLMEKHGFYNYENEWWHYTLKDEPFPKTYFDFPIK